MSFRPSTTTPRAALTDAAAIRTRMLSDLNSADWHADTIIDIGHFTRLGWTEQQARTHGPAAIERAAQSRSHARAH